MRRNLVVTRDTFELRTPFRISRGVKTAIEAITVELECDGFIGRGEGIPYARYGESVDGSIAAIEAARSEIEQGIGRMDLLDLMPAGAARNAVDCALWDLKTRRTATPVYRLLGLAQPPALTSALTISLDTPSAMAIAASKYGRAQTLKVKVDAVDPLASIRAVRAAAPASQLIVDPNESWSFNLLVAVMPELVARGVVLVEQPLPADADNSLALFSPPIPIAADESVHGIASLDAVADRYQVINIKLDKTGGLTAALMLAEAGRARGLQTMVGCMVCSSLSIGPAAHLASDARYIDLDGPIDLVADRPGRVSFDEMGALAFDGSDRLWGGL